MPIFVSGRRIYVNTRGTQTVKICTARNEQGVHEKYYRLEPRYVLQPAQIEQTIADFPTLADVERWLLDDRKATREVENEAAPVRGELAFVTEAKDSTDAEQPIPEALSAPSAVAEVLNLLRSDAYLPDQDEWLTKARHVVENAIDRLIDEFSQTPYLHRVEHSIHAHLFHKLISEDLLAVQVPIGAGFARTQLVHKEWPETIAREGNRRGNFDMAVLSPKLVETCGSMRTFREGRLQAPIVIEIGLDYDSEHLAEDAKKLMNSRPKHGYLIHLGRELPSEPEAEEILLGLESKFGIKTAYCWMTGSHKAMKRLGETSITHTESP